eukprot:scaffold75280_cov71-Phaeocystis_antarctica.AAC.1
MLWPVSLLRSTSRRFPSTRGTSLLSKVEKAGARAVAGDRVSFDLSPGRCRSVGGVGGVGGVEAESGVGVLWCRLEKNANAKRSPGGLSCVPPAPRSAAAGEGRLLALGARGNASARE